ncbi:MAG: RIP metalloprotease RseP [Vicinamibacterales bacterium]|nr:RIP metalloprotease RseP [Vicinamibacterales bacterium]
MTTLLAFAFVLGVLVFVHELGHFMMARWHGVRVLTFSLGFGPKLLSMRRGDTEYCVAAIPLGGYVKMAGENPEDPRSGSDDEFLSKSKWQRFQILIMGPVMNLLLAVVLLWVVLLQGAQVAAFQDEPVVIGVVQPGSPAEQAGLRPGDRVMSVAGSETATWDQFSLAIGTRPDRDTELVVMREGLDVRMTVRPNATTRYEVGDIGVLPDVYPSIGTVNPGDPADRAGLKAGDVLVSVAGERMVFAQHVSAAISKSAGQPIEIRVRRDGEEQAFTVTPELRGESGIIGVSLANATRTFQPGPVEALGLSVERNIEFAGLILQTVWGLVVGETSPRQLMGPVGIAQISGESAQLGWVALFALMATISLNLGLLNLLPIPVLDGGHILIIGLEAVARRDFSMQVKEKLFLGGFALLMVLMVTVIYNDLTRIAWIEQFMPWRN